MKCPCCGGPREKEDRCCQYCKTVFDDTPPASAEKQEIHIHYHQENRPDPQIRVEHIYTPLERRSDRSRVMAFLLCFFLGLWGVHKFYLGKNGMGVLYLFTFGLCGYGWLVDLFILLFGNPKDKAGYLLTWR